MYLPDNTVEAKWRNLSKSLQGEMDGIDPHPL